MSFINPQPCVTEVDEDGQCCPNTFIGFCLADETPISITMQGGAQLGWTNLLTGVFTAGPPPLGTVVCSAGTVNVGIDCLTHSITVCQNEVPWVSDYSYPEDTPHVSGDVGAFVLAVRNDAGLPLAADGDYIPFTTDATGALRVNATFSGEVVVSLDCATDSVTICPGDDPIDVIGTVTVNQGTSPWVIGDGGGSITVDAVDLDIRNLVFATDKVDVTGSTVSLDAGTLAALETITVLQGTSPWVVSAVDLDIRNLACGQDSIDACVTFDYAEDTPHVSGDVGAFILVVRNDAGTPLAADGDYIPLTTDATGALRVTGGSNQFEYPEDTPHVSGAIGAFTLAVRNDAGTPLAGDGDYIPFTTDSTGALRVTGGSGIYQHQEVLCDGDITFIRKYIQDVDGNVISVVDFDLDGVPYIVVGTVQVCGGDAPIVQTLDSTVDRLTGAGSIGVSSGSKSVTVIVLSGNPTVQIDADPVITLVPGMSLTWGVDDKTESLTNAFTFTGFLGSDFFVHTTSGPLAVIVIDSTVQRLAGVGSVVIAAGASSITVAVISGIPTVTIGGGPAIPLIAGMSMSWSVDADQEDLSDVFTFTGVLGSDFVVTSTRV